MGFNGFFRPRVSQVITQLDIVEVEFLVVAGGGGGGGIAGGGAGGYRFGTLSVSPNTNYGVTVGAGGAVATAFSGDGTNGSNSVFSTITSTPSININQLGCIIS